MPKKIIPQDYILCIDIYRKKMWTFIQKDLNCFIHLS